MLPNSSFSSVSSFNHNDGVTLRAFWNSLEITAANRVFWALVTTSRLTVETGLIEHKLRSRHTAPNIGEDATIAPSQGSWMAVWVKDKCLSGAVQLLSWTCVMHRPEDPSTQVFHTAKAKTSLSRARTRFEPNQCCGTLTSSLASCPHVHRPR